MQLVYKRQAQLQNTAQLRLVLGGRRTVQYVFFFCVPLRAFKYTIVFLSRSQRLCDGRRQTLAVRRGTSVGAVRRKACRAVAVLVRLQSVQDKVNMTERRAIYDTSVDNNTRGVVIIIIIVGFCFCFFLFLVLWWPTNRVTGPGSPRLGPKCWTTRARVRGFNARTRVTAYPIS